MEDVRKAHIQRASSARDLLAPVVDDLRSGSAKLAMKNRFELVSRSAVVRQYEALDHAIDAAQAEVAHVVAGIVRPAVEEFVTLSYLSSLPRPDVDEFLWRKLMLDLADSLEKQNRLYASFDVHQAEIRSRPAAETQEMQRAMVRLAEEYNWPIRGKGESKTSYGPTMRYMAEQTGNEELYDYLYGAASRLVHFSPYELLRRTWFDHSDQLRIGGHDLERWWSSFALGWCTSLLCDSSKLVLEITAIPPRVPIEQLAELATECKRSVPPLVTLGELNLSPSQAGYDPFTALTMRRS